MPYYQGDYYRGDYYRGMSRRGDPGLLGTVAGAALRIGSSFIPGGGLISTAIGALAGARPGGTVSRVAGAIFPSQPAAAAQIKFGPIGVNPSNIFPGGKPFVTAVGAGTMSGCPRGTHPDKRSGERCVQNRSMNPANPRALRRAIRREQAFVALARRSLRGTGLSITRTGLGRKARTRKR